jgi:hypothetical protein
MLPLALALFLAANTPSVSAWILTEGDAHWIKATDVPKSGWIGMFARDGKASLRNTAVVTKPTGTRSDDPLEVHATQPGAMFLFHSVPVISPGPIDEAQWSDDDSDGSLVPGKPIDLRLRGTRYRVTLTASDRALANSNVSIETGGRKQTLFSMSGSGDEPHFAILWAGDLDRDGKLDLITTFSPKYSWYPRTLYLSSQAEEGEIVHEVAMFEDFSC